ncbi:MAG: ribose-5-phosphate isomerase RpiA [Thermoplasmata archaeon]
MKRLKRLSGEAACDFVKDGMVVGLGTGSTVHYTIKKLGRMVDRGLRIIGIPTSIGTENLARQCKIPLSNLNEHPRVDISIDGADEVDPKLNLIKGMGGALVREKIVASVSRRLIIVIDQSKQVSKLGSKSPVPVEVLPFGWGAVMKKIEKMGAQVGLRRSKKIPFVSDNGNYILDSKFEEIASPKRLERKLNNIPGVVENGLFLKLANLVLVGTEQGVEKMR